MIVCVVFLCVGILSAVSLPVQNEVKDKKHDPNEIPSIPNLDLEEYKRYLEESRNQPDFNDRIGRIKNFDFEKLKDLMAKNPRLQERLSRGGVDREGGVAKAEALRTQVEEARRQYMEQMRQLQRVQSMRDNDLMKDGDWITKKEAIRENLSPDFTDQQIQSKIAEVQRHLQELDQQRKEEFKREEMWLEHRRKQKLAEMNEQQRLKSEAAYAKKQEEVRHHERIPHPASKEHLETVWENEDGMAKTNFDPKTFFHMHDTNGDKMLDAMELEALFYQELKKVYKDDMGGIESKEDMARMREHALAEMDKDTNGLISIPEFLAYTQNKLFDNNEEWHPIVDQEKPPFSDEDFAQFEDEYEDEYDYQYDSEGNVIGIIRKKDTEGDPHPGNEQGHPQDGNEQGHPQANEQEHAPEAGNERGHPPQDDRKQGQPQANEQGHAPQDGNEKGAKEQGRQEDPDVLPGNPNEVPMVQVEDPHFMGEHKDDQRGAGRQQETQNQQEAQNQQEPNRL